MAGPVTQIFKRFPTTIWFTVGVTAYAWKASLIASMYEHQYASWNQQRVDELQKIK